MDLEKIAANLADPNICKTDNWVAGARYVLERSYSEDEVKVLIEKALTHRSNNHCGSLVTAEGEIRTANFRVWFEAIKKK